MKNYIVFLSLLLGITGSAKAQFSYTIKAGPAVNQVQYFIKPTATFTGKLTQISIVVGYQTSCAATQPTVAISPAASWLSTMGNVVYGTPIYDKGTTITPAGYTYHVCVLSQQNSPTDGTLVAGTEYLVGTITFTGGTPACSIFLMDLQDGGSTTNGNTYIVDQNDTYYYPYGGSATFYSGTVTSPNTAGSTTSSGSGFFFATTNSSVSLPLTLLSFTATDKACKAQLDWSTAAEINTGYFDIESSDDGRSFRSIGRVEAQGNGNGRSYQFATGQPAGNTFYRLKMVDLDGTFTYSPVRRLQVNCKLADKFNIWPNPTRGAGTLNASITTSYSGAALLQVIAADGRIVDRRHISLVAGVNNLTLPVDNMPGGIYTVQAIAPQGRVIGNIQKLVINR